MKKHRTKSDRLAQIEDFEKNGLTWAKFCVDKRHVPTKALFS